MMLVSCLDGQGLMDAVYCPTQLSKAVSVLFRMADSSALLVPGSASAPLIPLSPTNCSLSLPKPFASPHQHVSATFASPKGPRTSPKPVGP